MPVSTVTLASTGSTSGLYKHYNTRSNSIAQPTPHPVTKNKPTGNIQKSKITLKSLTPVLQLDKTECATTSKTSSTPIQGAQRDNLNLKSTVKLHSSAAIAGNPSSELNPLCDDSESDDDSLQQFIHYHHFTSNISYQPSQVEIASTGRILEFFGIDAREYEVIEEALGETGRAFKPRLSYDYEKQSLLVDMPSAIHEALFDCLKLTLGQTIASLPYDHDTIYPMIHMNSSLKGPTKIRLVPFFGECACSEDKKHAIDKLAKTIRAHPDIKMAVLGLVRKAQPYHHPKCDSHAWNFFSTDPEPLPLEEFITERFPSCSSITIAGHNWCHVSSVEFLVWFQGDDEAAIDLNKEDAEHMAYSTLLPDLNMDAVKVMFQRGLEKIRDSLVTFSKQLDPSIDCTELEKAPITFLPIWKDYLIACRNGADVTAWTRYTVWYEEVISDRKKNPNASGASGSRSRGCPKRISSSYLEVETRAPVAALY
ncbi:hypothetical protein DFJ58DRAFT_734428 [Suillus subalutaceus]|uniref:uncharacterized protein n=1 Tax=Suillus subalutaceus TaxID=48586 RepID=UPI001B872441|nr:uncharacterized protein DFJ58DRAFT_734428 [Suillus subalutaceus]KAG1837305.1 hypothetical protein DFJ58DRAFT_734428 [Suillus subalutaceus]